MHTIVQSDFIQRGAVFPDSTLIVFSLSHYFRVIDFQMSRVDYRLTPNSSMIITCPDLVIHQPGFKSIYNSYCTPPRCGRVGKFFFFVQELRSTSFFFFQFLKQNVEGELTKAETCDVLTGSPAIRLCQASSYLCCALAPSYVSCYAAAYYCSTCTTRFYY